MTDLEKAQIEIEEWKSAANDALLLVVFVGIIALISLGCLYTSIPYLPLN